jgi:hypothetical protein
MEIYTSIYDMFRKCEVKMSIAGRASIRRTAPVRWGLRGGGVGDKKSPDVETPGLRYLDLISVVD